MVAIIKSGYSIHRTFNYNENKVKEGVAVCIGAGNYPIDPQDMTVGMRLNGLLKRIELSQRSKRNSVHISLNFDPSEKELTPEKLLAVAERYMEKIGFADQPFLVYQHHDAGHPHIHIVTTNIKTNGKSIDTHMIGVRKSEPARKAIEKEFGLVKAEAQKNTADFRLKSVSAAEVSYGKSETRQAIQNVLENVLKKYRYGSLAELNALLSCYNVAAQPGEEGSRVNRHGGLLYRVLDETGNPVGVPIKASSFYNRPTLKKLKPYFIANKTESQRYKSRTKNAVDKVLSRSGIDLKAFTDELAKQGIDVVLRKNEDGFLYGITYVDHVTKCVFNGSALGKPYSAKNIRERCGVPLVYPVAETKERQVGKSDRQDRRAEKAQHHPPISNDTFRLLIGELFEQLFQQEFVPDYVPYELSIRKRKKKRKRRSGN